MAVVRCRGANLEGVSLLIIHKWDRATYSIATQPLTPTHSHYLSLLTKTYTETPFVEYLGRVSCGIECAASRGIEFCGIECAAASCGIECAARVSSTGAL